MPAADRSHETIINDTLARLLRERLGDTQGIPSEETLVSGAHGRRARTNSDVRASLSPYLKCTHCAIIETWMTGLNGVMRRIDSS